MKTHDAKPKVTMAVTNDLVTDRRVLRHADALREMGCEVELVGRGKPIETRAKRGWRFYAEYNLKLWRMLRKGDADIVWANDSDTLLGCWLAARKGRRLLVVDAHELFPEVPEIQDKPWVKWTWATIERWLLPRADARLTVCESIAKYYGGRYGVEMTVVRNLPERGKRERRGRREGEERVMLYQGAVNVGRGVDWAIDAVGLIEDCRLMVVGGGDLLEEMKAYAATKPWRSRIEFVGRMKPEELVELTAEADVGLVMLEDMGLSYHFALPNRVGDFVAAGVPIVVSDLPEMAAVVRRFGVGEVMERAGAEALAEAVKRVLARNWREGDFAAAREDMDWEKEKKKLQTVVERVLRERREMMATDRSEKK